MEYSWPAAVRRLLLIAAVLVGVEALAVIGLALADLASLDGGRIAVGVGSALFLLLYGGAQLAAAVLLVRGRAGARGPIVASQLVQLGIAWSLRGVDADALAVSGLPWILAATAVAVLACVLAPAVNRAMLARESAAEATSSDAA
ncbi:MAG: hypothetical protein QM597_06000 [Aeromicrobium sp.]|uniref:hypothetical protein n=1 Tax=Aeromicrobium sp. TaxID=1871063 RepID=UPI0039E685AC